MSIEVNSEKLYFSDSKAVVIVAKATGSKKKKTNNT